LISGRGERSHARRDSCGDYHANLIYNAGGGTAADLCALIVDLKTRVRDRFGLELKKEVQYVGWGTPVAPAAVRPFRVLPPAKNLQQPGKTADGRFWRDCSPPPSGEKAVSLAMPGLEQAESKSASLRSVGRRIMAGSGPGFSRRESRLMSPGSRGKVHMTWLPIWPNNGRFRKQQRTDK
jgi:UDP-N-acetylenolpyruvoylglucosamine reductase, C-terminal domain